MKANRLILIAITIFANFASLTFGKELNKFDLLTAKKAGNELHLVFSFASPPTANLNILDKAIQVEVKSSFINPSKKKFKIENVGIASAMAYQYDKKTLRIRVFPEYPLSEIVGKVSLKTVGNDLILMMPNMGAVVKTASAPIKENEAPFAKQALESAPKKEISNAVNSPTPLDDSKQFENTEDMELLADFGKADSATDDTSGFLDYQEPTAPEIPSMGSAITKVASALMVVLGLVLLTAWIARKYLKVGEGRFGGMKEVKVLSNHFIGVKKSVTLIEVGGEVMLLGVTNSNINLLAHYTDPEKIEKIKLDNRLPKEPLGVSKKIPGVSWGIGAKKKVSKKFSNQVAAYGKEMEEKLKVKEQENKELTSNNSVSDIVSRIKDMREAGVGI